MLLRFGTARVTSHAVFNQPASSCSLLGFPDCTPKEAGVQTNPLQVGGATRGRSPAAAARREPGATGGAYPIGGWPKRLADLLTAGSTLVLVSPLLLLIVALIKATSKGPVIFAHNRIGFEGRAFKCLKFRTMVIDADRVLAEHLARDPAAAEEWRESQKLSHDPRVTPFGRILRKTSLDELPQLFNILKGDMSCVGPRPIVQEELDRYGPVRSEYFGARPGLTGLWQVTGRSSTDYAHRVSLDAQYLRNWSLWADFGILCRTTLAVMRINEAC
jgi:exopolysaccharide production protein ExoY